MITQIESASARLALLEFADEARRAIEYGVSMDNCANPKIENMITPIDEVFARLTALGFALEIALAQALSRESPEFSKQLKEYFLQKSRGANLPDSLTPSSNENVVEIFHHSCRLTEEFIQRVAIREAEMRAQRGDNG
jgi:hypothetical protein